MWVKFLLLAEKEGDTVFYIANTKVIAVLSAQIPTERHPRRRSAELTKRTEFLDEDGYPSGYE